MSDPVIHFVVSGITGASIKNISYIYLNEIQDKKRPSINISNVIWDFFIFGFIGCAVDLDHFLSDTRPLHLTMLFITTVASIVSLILWRIFIKSKVVRLSTITSIILGLNTAVFAHYSFDYLVACLLVKEGLICFKDGTAGEKLKIILSIPFARPSP